MIETENKDKDAMIADLAKKEGKHEFEVAIEQELKLELLCPPDAVDEKDVNNKGEDKV